MPYLKDIAAIRSGYLFRGKIEADPAGKYRIIQTGNISPDAGINGETLTRVNLPEVKPALLVAVGDILFISRGPRKQAVAIMEDLPNTLATAQFFVVRPEARALSEYLAWYISQRPAQRYIEEHSTGGSNSLINLEAIKQLPVELPPIEQQARIVRIHQLSLREKTLLEAIQTQRRLMVEMTLLKSVMP